MLSGHFACVGKLQCMLCQVMSVKNLQIYLDLRNRQSFEGFLLVPEFPIFQDNHEKVFEDLRGEA